MRLKKSKVEFNEAEHTYHLNGTEMFGVTGMLSRHLFKEKYSGIPKEVLDKAAERGSRVHKAIEVFNEKGLMPNDFELGIIVDAYKGLCEERGLKAEASEYLVTDNICHASAIDIVMSNAGNIILADIKTTSKIDEEYLSWQLSVYKYMFELLNPKLKVSGAVCVWLPNERYGKPTVRDIIFKSEEEVKRLLETDAQYLKISQELDFQNFELATTPEGDRYAIVEKIEYLERELAKCSFVPQVTEKAVSPYVSMENKFIELLQTIKRYEEAKKELEGKFLEVMRKQNDIKWETERLSIARVLPTTRKSFDSKRFEQEHPDLYQEYVKESAVKESIRITLKKNSA